MSHIIEDEFDYYLSDEDYIAISENIKNDIYCTFISNNKSFRCNKSYELKCNKPYESYFTLDVGDGVLEVCYSFYIKDKIPEKKEDITIDMIQGLSVSFWGTDRDGEDWESEVECDLSELKF